MRYIITKVANGELDIRFDGYADNDNFNMKKYCSIARTTKEKFLKGLRKKVNTKNAVQKLEFKNGVLSFVEVEIDEKSFRDGYNVTSSTFELKKFKKDDNFVQELEKICKSYEAVKEETRDIIFRKLVAMGKYSELPPMSKASFILKQYMRWGTLTAVDNRTEAKSVVECFIENKKRLVKSASGKYNTGKLATFIKEYVLPSLAGISTFSLAGSAFLGPLALIPASVSAVLYGATSFGLRKSDERRISKVIDKVVYRFMEKYDLAIEPVTCSLKFKEVADDDFVEGIKKDINRVNKCFSSAYDEISEALNSLLEEYYTAKDLHAAGIRPFDKYSFFKKLNVIRREISLIENKGVAFDATTNLVPEGMDLYDRDSITDEFMNKIYINVKELVAVAARGCELELIQLRKLARKYAKSEIKYAKSIGNVERITVIRNDLALIESTVASLYDRERQYVPEKDDEDRVLVA